jgi:hypothetical protein
MEIKFKAGYLCAQTEHDVIMVGFADREFETEEYVLLQGSLTYDDQDRKLGLDKVHITYKDQLYSAYGGIQGVVLQKGNVKISVSPDTARALGAEEEIEIEFSAQDPKLPEIKLHLELLFKEEPGVFVSEI